MTKHTHEPGDTVTVAKRDADPVEITLGERLLVQLGDNIVRNCFLIAKQTLRAVDSKTATEVSALEKLYTAYDRPPPIPPRLRPQCYGTHAAFPVRSLPTRISPSWHPEAISRSLSRGDARDLSLRDYK